MEYINTIVLEDKTKDWQKEYGDYTKITLDINKEVLMIGCELHADGEAILLEKGSNQNDIWGGGINFTTKEIDTTAVLNLKPRLSNNSLEILDPEKREKFITVVKKLLAALWEK